MRYFCSLLVADILPVLPALSTSLHNVCVHVVKQLSHNDFTTPLIVSSKTELSKSRTVFQEKLYHL